MPPRRHGRAREALALALLLPCMVAFAGNEDRPATLATPSGAASIDDAPKGSGFALARQVVAGGGGSSSGGAFRIDGTIAQVDADPLHPATGGVFAVSGGFWPGLVAAAPQGEDVFADGFEPPSP